LKLNIEQAVEDGKVSNDDAQAALKFLGAKRHLSLTNYVYAKKGIRKDLQNGQDYQATERVMTAMGANEIPLSTLTAEPLENQFWSAFDQLFNLTEVSMREHMPFFITDPNNRMKVQAILDGRRDAVGGAEETKQLSA